MMPLHDEPCMWPQVACTCDPYTEVATTQNSDMEELARRVGKRPELAMGYGNSLNIRRPGWWSCRCSACVLQRQEKDDQYRDNAANGHF